MPETKPAEVRRPLGVGDRGEDVRVLRGQTNEVAAHFKISHEIAIDGPLSKAEVEFIRQIATAMGAGTQNRRAMKQGRIPLSAQRLIRGRPKTRRERKATKQRASYRQDLRSKYAIKIGKVISREEWGAAAPRGSFAYQVELFAGVQHHTAMPALPATATIAQECARMRQIQAIHQGQGWTDIGYALVVFPSGRIYEGRPAKYVGAHTLGHNTGYGGFSLDGNYEVDRPTKAAIRACHECRVILGVDDKPLYGHYELGPTACPGKNLKPHLRKEI